MTIKKLVLLLLMSLVPLVLTGCDGFLDQYCDSAQAQYEKGYEAAWEGKKKPPSFSSQQKKDGYQDGLDDSAMYDEGYQDGIDKKRPKHFDDDDYMDGYKDGKDDR